MPQPHVTVAAPGFYDDLTNEDYQRDAQVAPELGRTLSSSGVKALLNLPARFEYERENGRAPKDAFERCPADRCSVLVADNGLPCNEPATVSVHAGHDYYAMCIGHGLPFLTEEMR